MNELALFAGAGGGLLASNLLGWRTICAVENDPFARSIIFARQRDNIFPRFPIWDDVKTFNSKRWRGYVDIISGGYPCQPFSTASRGQKTAKDLWPEMQRVISEVCPNFVFVENVSKSSIDNACTDLQLLGYKTSAISLSARDLGADHLRIRYWACAYSNDKSELRSYFHAKMGKREKFCHSIWKTKPNESTVLNGMARRVDQYRVIGNGQVPIVAATAWQLLIESIIS